MDSKLNLPKFLKVLALTSSDNDGEALSAIRTATSMLSKSNMTWAALFQESSPRSDVLDHYAEAWKTGSWRSNPPHFNAQDQSNVQGQYNSGLGDIFSNIFGKDLPK